MSKLDYIHALYLLCAEADDVSLHDNIFGNAVLIRGCFTFV